MEGKAAGFVKLGKGGGSDGTGPKWQILLGGGVQGVIWYGRHRHDEARESRDAFSAVGDDSLNKLKLDFRRRGIFPG